VRLLTAVGAIVQGPMRHDPSPHSDQQVVGSLYRLCLSMACRTGTSWRLWAEVKDQDIQAAPASNAAPSQTISDTQARAAPHPQAKPQEPPTPSPVKRPAEPQAPMRAVDPHEAAKNETDPKGKRSQKPLVPQYRWEMEPHQIDQDSRLQPLTTDHGIYTPCKSTRMPQGLISPSNPSACFSIGSGLLHEG
jgi:hypothetical protein